MILVQKISRKSNVWKSLSQFWVKVYKNRSQNLIYSCTPISCRIFTNLGFVPKIFRLIQYGDLFSPFSKLLWIDKGCVIPMETFRFCVTVKVNLKSFRINYNFISHTYFLKWRKNIFQTKLVKIQSKLVIYELFIWYLPFDLYFQKYQWNFYVYTYVSRLIKKLSLYLTSFNDLFGRQLTRKQIKEKNFYSVWF